LEGDLEPLMGGVHWQSLAYSVWEQFMCVAMVVSLLVWFRDRLNHQGRLARAMSAAAYATYVLFAPVIVLLALALSRIRLNMVLKFLLISPVAVILCFLVGHCFRKPPLVRGIL
jgi:glucan biosynthesis protein C